MKRFLTSFLCLALAVSLLTGVSFAASGMDNFKKTNSYQSGRFSDVSQNAWYESGLAAAYDFGLVNGVSDKSFGVGSHMTIAEAVTLAARLHSIYHTGSASFAATEPWHQAYVDYAVENGIMSDRRFGDYTLDVTRLQFAELMAASLPGAALGQINNIATGEIPDVSLEGLYAPVYTLYNAGVLTGKTDAGHFEPAQPILREEVATLVARMADPSLRKTFSLKPGAGTGETALAETVRLATQAGLEAAQYCASAGAAVDGDPTTFALLLLKTRELSAIMSQRIKEAAEAAKDKSELKAVFEDLETAQFASLEANKLVSALSAGSGDTAWATAIKMLEGCTTALGRAADALR